MLRKLPTLTLALIAGLLLIPPVAEGQTSSSNTAVITTNPYLGTPISEYDQRVSRYSPYGAQNPYTTRGGRIYGQDGTYLGRLNANQYDSESVANPYGRYGSPYSSTSINNPYSRYPDLGPYYAAVVEEWLAERGFLNGEEGAGGTGR